MHMVNVTNFILYGSFQICRSMNSTSGRLALGLGKNLAYVAETV